MYHESRGPTCPWESVGPGDTNTNTSIAVGEATAPCPIFRLVIVLGAGGFHRVRFNNLSMNPVRPTNFSGFAGRCNGFARLKVSDGPYLRYVVTIRIAFGNPH